MAKENLARKLANDLHFEIRTRMAKTPSGASNGHVDPGIRSKTHYKTAQLAKNQTAAARELLRAPGEEAQLQLQKTAGGMLEILGQLDQQGKEAFFNRLLGDQGSLKGQSVDDAMAALDRVATGSEQVSVMDNIAVVALSGDLGALLSDTRAQGTQRDQTEADKILEATMAVFPEMEEQMEISKSFGRSSLLGPNKGTQRSRTDALYERTGVHNLGRKVDRKAGKDATEINTMNPKKAMIDKNRVKKTEEPFIAHISGSPHEIVTTMRVLSGDKSDMTQAENARGHEQMSRVALANAFLIGNGLHSALEVLEASLKLTHPESYTEEGQAAYNASKNQEDGFFQETRNGVEFSGDMGSVAYNGAATELVIEGMESYTQNGGLKFTEAKTQREGAETTNQERLTNLGTPANPPGNRRNQGRRNNERGVAANPRLNI